MLRMKPIQQHPRLLNNRIQTWREANPEIVKWVDAEQSLFGASLRETLHLYGRLSLTQVDVVRQRMAELETQCSDS